MSIDRRGIATQLKLVKVNVTYVHGLGWASAPVFSIDISKSQTGRRPVTHPKRLLTDTIYRERTAVDRIPQALHEAFTIPPKYQPRCIQFDRDQLSGRDQLQLNDPASARRQGTEHTNQEFHVHVVRSPQKVVTQAARTHSSEGRRLTTFDRITPMARRMI